MDGLGPRAHVLSCKRAQSLASSLTASTSEMGTDSEAALVSALPHAPLFGRWSLGSSASYLRKEATRLSGDRSAGRAQEELDDPEQGPYFSIISVLNYFNMRLDLGIARLNGASDQMSQRFLPSSQAQISLSYPIRLGKGHFFLRPALAVGWDNYSFSKDILLKHNGSRTTLVSSTSALHYAPLSGQVNESSSSATALSLSSSRFQSTTWALPSRCLSFHLLQRVCPELFFAIGGYLYYIVSSSSVYAMR